VNLLSVSKLSERGHTTIFSPDGCHIYRNASVKVKGEFVASATEENGMYSLNCETYSHCANTAVTKCSDKLNLWHRTQKTTNLKTSSIMGDNKKIRKSTPDIREKQNESAPQRDKARSIQKQSNISKDRGEDQTRKSSRTATPVPEIMDT
jgi:hypothetical protein